MSVQLKSLAMVTDGMAFLTPHEPVVPVKPAVRA